MIDFDKEADLLTRWQQFVEEVDPDLIIGYNISQFDLPYLIDRAKALKASEFPYLGRLKSESLLSSSPRHIWPDILAPTPLRRQDRGQRYSLLVESLR